MSKITETSRLKSEDFPKDARWINPLIDGYNNFLTQAIRLLNKGLIFSDNSVGLEHDFEFTFQTAAATFPQRVKWPYNAFPPKHLTVTQATATNSPIPVVTSWQFTDDRFVELLTVYYFTTVPALASLVAGTKYKIRVKIEA